jgi:hypothetical protein
LKIFFSRTNMLRGALIYASGDTIAALIQHDFSWTRLLGMMLVGATFYALEIPYYFAWIEKKVKGRKGFVNSLFKTSLAMLYFNPLWIARHLLFINLFSGNLENINLSLLSIASWSFLVNIPISLLGNYVIQNLIPLKWRFISSAIFSALLAIYYAMSMVWFD